MTRDELRNIIIEADSVLKKLKEVWCYLEDEDIEKATKQMHLPCDACEGEKEDEE